MYTKESFPLFATHEHHGLCIVKCTIHLQCPSFSTVLSYPSNYTVLLHSPTLTDFDIHKLEFKNVLLN